MYVFSPYEVGDRPLDEVLILRDAPNQLQLTYELSRASRTARWLMRIIAWPLLLGGAILIGMDGEEDERPVAIAAIALIIGVFSLIEITSYRTYIDSAERTVTQEWLLFGRLRMSVRRVNVTDAHTLHLTYSDYDGESHHNLMHSLKLHPPGHRWWRLQRSNFLLLADQSMTDREESRTLRAIGLLLAKSLSIELDVSKAFVSEGSPASQSGERPSQ